MSQNIVTTSMQVFLNPDMWKVMTHQATVLVKSGFLPKDINTPEKAVAIMMKGYELGIPPMQAFAHINIINGKLAISAELMLSLIYKHCPGATIDFIKLELDVCIIEASRPKGRKTLFKFDKEDAKLAGLLNKNNWKTFPRAMYRSRCISEMARTLFADSIMGCGYTPEELDPSIDIDDSGQIVEVKYIEQKQQETKREEQQEPEAEILSDEQAKNEQKKKLTDAYNEKVKQLMIDRKLSNESKKIVEDSLQDKDICLPDVRDEVKILIDKLSKDENK